MGGLQIQRYNIGENRLMQNDEKGRFVTFADAEKFHTQLVEALDKAKNELTKVRMQLNLAQGREVKLCGNHHGKGYDHADCILCDFEHRRTLGIKQLVEALKDYKRLYEKVQPRGGWQGVYELGNVALEAAGEKVDHE